MSLLDSRNPLYEEQADIWEFTWKNYTGLYTAHNRQKFFSRNKYKQDYSDEFLHRKVQAETVEAFIERLLISDPILLFATAIDSLCGMVFSREDKIVREFGNLGDPEQDSFAARFIENADGSGMNLEPLMKKVAVHLTTLHGVWGLVDGVMGDKEPSLKVISRQSVVDWYPSLSRPTEVLVKEERDNRAGIGEKEKGSSDVYVHYTLDGWVRYAKNDKGQEEILGSGEYEYYEDTQRTIRTLPIYYTELPMPRPIGYLLAVKQNHIYNKKSIRDFAIRNISFAFLQIVADEGQYETFLSELEKGYRVIRLDPDASKEHSYKSPDSSYLAEAGEIIKNDVEGYMKAAFQSFGDAAKQTTATEVRQESRSGVEAFLNLLVTSLDEFENRGCFLLEQTMFPNSPNQWNEAFSKRNQDFTPKDVEEAMRKASETVRNAKQANAMSVRTAVKTMHPEWTEEEIDEEVQNIRSDMGALEVPDNMVGA
jgi:hypothetical protein